MEIFICNICKKEYSSILSLLRHSLQKHNIGSKPIYVNTVYNVKNFNYNTYK